MNVKRYVLELLGICIFLGCYLVIQVWYVKPEGILHAAREKEYADTMALLEKKFGDNDLSSIEDAKAFVKKFDHDLGEETKAKIFYKSYQVAYQSAKNDLQKFVKNAQSPNYVARPNIKEIDARFEQSLELLKQAEKGSLKTDLEWKIRLSRGNTLLTKAFIGAIFLQAEKGKTRRDLMEAKDSLEKAKALAPTPDAEKHAAQNLDFLTRVMGEKQPEKTTGKGLGTMLGESEGQADQKDLKCNQSSAMFGFRQVLAFLQHGSYFPKNQAYIHRK